MVVNCQTRLNACTFFHFFIVNPLIVAHVSDLHVSCLISDYNYAIGRTATQSSTATDHTGTLYPADQAIDGSYGWESSASSTGIQYHPWWKVNLGKGILLKKAVVSTSILSCVPSGCGKCYGNDPFS